ncbi:RHS repeat-associated core domain-containing protein [Pseudomonas monteilii]
MVSYFYRGSECVVWLDGLGSKSVFKQGEVSLAARVRAPNTDELHLMGNDVLKSVLCHVSEMSMYSRAYDTYGYSMFLGGPPIGFAGEVFDRVGNQYVLGMGHRRYLPTIRRFNRPDDESPFRQGGLNAYAYVAGDPINFSDPSGRWRMRKPQSQTFITPVSERVDRPIFLGVNVEDQRSGRALAIAFTGDDTTLINGHGNYREATVGWYTAKEVLNLMNEQGIELASGPIHLLSCKGYRKSTRNLFSNKSLAQDFADLTGRKVIAYKNKVSLRPILEDGKGVGFFTALDIGKPKQREVYPSAARQSTQRESFLHKLMSALRGK